MNQGIPVILTRIKTRDGVTLDGIYIKPKRKGDTALIWLHGLTSYFYSGQALIKELSSRCRKQGIGYLKFNTRGHDVVARGTKHPLGAAFEKFEDCVYDIRAMIRFAKGLGYKNIILAGHSTGANKALYYLYQTKDWRVKGLILLGPTSDIDFDLKKFGKGEVTKRLALAEKLKQKDPHRLLPQKFGIWSARRLVSILSPGAREDVFPYYNQKAQWKELRSVRVPVAVIFGSRDEYLTSPAKELIEVFRNHSRAKSFSGVIVRGANHGFIKKEKELAKVIVGWIKRMHN